MPEFPNKNDDVEKERERVSNTLHGAVTARILRSILRLSLSIPTPALSVHLNPHEPYSPPDSIESRCAQQSSYTAAGLALLGFSYFNFIYDSLFLNRTFLSSLLRKSILARVHGFFPVFLPFKTPKTEQFFHFSVRGGRRDVAFHDG